jgi:uncharacterized protein YjbI with pentapeptide repeats
MSAELTRMDAREVENAIRQGATVENADLSGLDMTGVNLHLGRFHGCVLDRADVSGQKLEKTGFRDCSLKGARFRGCSFTDMFLRKLDFSGADFQGALFLRTHLSGSSLAGRTSRGARALELLDKTDLTGACFHRRTPQKRVPGGDLRRADFSGAA